MKAKVAGEGTKAKPWKLKTPSGSSDYEMIARKTPIRPPSCAWSARPSFAITCARSRIFTRC